MESKQFENFTYVKGSLMLSFTGPFIISIYCKNLPKSHPKHRLVAEESAPLFGFLFDVIKG